MFRAEGVPTLYSGLDYVVRTPPSWLQYTDTQGRNLGDISSIELCKYLTNLFTFFGSSDQRIESIKQTRKHL